MCYNPILVMKKGTKKKDGSIALENQFAQCGQCPVCKARRVSDWVFRLLKEDQVSVGNYFITLTYDSKNVPITKKLKFTLEKEAWQNFMKRLRKKQPEKIKYYAVGEYGSKTERPHYHGILFNVKEERFIFEAWINPETKEPFGDVHIGQVNGATIAYTAKYIDKPIKIPVDQNDDRLKPFSLMSKGLGSSYVEVAKQFHQEDYLKNMHYKAGDASKLLPRYIRTKIFTDEQREEQKQQIINSIDNEYMRLEAAYYHSPHFKNSNHSYEEYIRIQQQAAIQSKARKETFRTKI